MNPRVDTQRNTVKTRTHLTEGKGLREIRGKEVRGKKGREENENLGE